MNIFVLDKDPKLAAQYLCDKHVPKMILETAQLMCSPFEKAPYKRTHYNHPCAIWTRQRAENYWWLFQYGVALGSEYSKRYNNKIHKSYYIISWCIDHWDKLELPRPWPEGISDPPQCMPDKYKIPGDPVQAYRNYYKGDKARFAKWEKGSPVPEWWNK